MYRRTESIAGHVMIHEFILLNKGGRHALFRQDPGEGEGFTKGIGIYM